MPHKVAATSFQPRPMISMKNNNFGIQGEPLEFNCSVEYPIGMSLHMDWTTPNDNIALLVKTFSLQKFYKFSQNDCYFRFFFHPPGKSCKKARTHYETEPSQSIISHWYCSNDCR